MAFGWIGATMAFGAVEGRSQTDVRERPSAAPRSENIAVYVSPRDPNAPLIAPQR
jgi:hypothetical protein